MSRRLFKGDHPHVADSLNNMATVLDALGRSTEALQLLEEALAMRRRLFKGDHPHVATSLNNMAVVLDALGRSTDALQLLEEALAMRRRLFKGDHPDVASSLYSLAGRRRDLGDLSSSRDLFVEGLAMKSRLVTEALPQVSGPDRARWVSSLTDYALPLRRLALVRGSTVPASDGYLGLLWSKGVMMEASRSERVVLFELTEADSAAKTLLDEQGRLQSERAMLASPLRPGALTEGQIARLLAIMERLTDLDRLLRDTSPAYAEQARLAEISVKDVAGSLRPGEALVEFAVFRPLLPNPDAASQRKFVVAQAEHYAAFLLRPDTAAPDGFAVAAVDLGERRAIDSAVGGFLFALDRQLNRNKQGLRMFDALPTGDRRAMERELVSEGSSLRALVWDPLAGHLAGVTRVYVSPDAQLHGVPFEALPTGEDAQGRPTYLVESMEIVYQAGGRELARARLARSVEPNNTAVLLADPDFDADGGQRAAALQSPQDALAGQPTPTEKPSPRISAAGGTPDESLAERLTATLGGGGGQCVVGKEWPRVEQTGLIVEDTFVSDVFGRSVTVLPALKQAAASKTALQRTLEQHPRPRVLQVATHGYYCVQPPAAPAPRASSDLMMVDRDEPLPPDPMLGSMLILAGANPGKQSPEDNGLLTAAEVMALNLRGTEVVGLTACHSGQGELQTGEGVAGLRMAFAVAGARTVLQSLWEVPAQESLDQTRAFYTNWLKHHQPRYTAFRNAQLGALAKARQSTGTGHPWLWAGFTFAGDPGDLPNGGR